MSNAHSVPPQNDADARLTAALVQHRADLAVGPKLSHYEQARREAALYALATPESKTRAGSSNMRLWLAYYLDRRKVHVYEQHAALWAKGDAVAELWEMLDGPERMALHTATTLLRQAKNIAITKGYALPEAVGIVLAEYRRAPLQHQPNGSTFRRTGGLDAVVKKALARARSGVRRPEAAEAPPPPSKKDRRTRTKKAPASPAAAASGETRSANADVRKIVGQLVVDRLEAHGAEPGSDVILRSVQAVGIELEALFATVGRILARAEHEIKGNALPLPSRRKLNEAFRLLNMEPPKDVKAINMKAVLKQKQRMAALYHPDAHGGDRSMEPQYNAVIEAYEVIKTYVQEQQHNN